MSLIHVLIIEDDGDDYFLLSDTLKNIKRQEFKLDWASTYESGLSRLKEQQHDIYIIDYLLGAKTGIDLITEAIAAKCQQPMILLTGMDNADVDLAAAQLGAVDYIVKDALNEERMERSIRYALAQSASARALRASERKYRMLFEQASDMIFVADLQGHMSSISSAAEEVTGFTAAELTGRTFQSLFQSAEQVEALLLKLTTEGEVINQESQILCKDGVVRTCAVSIKKHLDHSGQVYYQGLLHDMTAIIREQRALLMQDKMEATGRLMRTLAHEVRNPLTNIHLALEGVALAELPEDHEVHDYVDIIRRNSNRISDLITELLNSSRPAELKLLPCSLQSVLEEVLTETSDRINLRKMKVIRSFDEGEDKVMLDKSKMKIAFTNIIINALEAMEEGKGVLEIGSWIKPGKIILFMRDNGIGIPPENLTRLFEPYFTSKTTGMGLGLASTLNILKAHGATVDVESTVGAGTIFWLTFDLIAS
ncbi:MAG: PAS domain S-box protein [Saprospiraceae bacterium]|nr:PAS domain S-box protein [Saprospiraceae bacterium]